MYSNNKLLYLMTWHVSVFLPRDLHGKCRICIIPIKQATILREKHQLLCSHCYKKQHMLTSQHASYDFIANTSTNDGLKKSVRGKYLVSNLYLRTGFYTFKNCQLQINIDNNRVIFKRLQITASNIIARLTTMEPLMVHFGFQP